MFLANKVKLLGTGCGMDNGGNFYMYIGTSRVGLGDVTTFPVVNIECPFIKLRRIRSARDS